ncbi:hypothetical protein GN244_ATG20656 [Phytophthora infestans]|uniref:Uncharacterized protein n=1 Tax=Phytophthora infestans TaxID=4787 RepID=A0A833SIW5_PHYIN|nr:hypothetical protein GN244_ATG20656 [Phytophthora infestans]
MDGFAPYTTDAFVMEIPEGKHVPLGIPWLVEANPDIDWKSRAVSCRGTTAALSLTQCVRATPACHIGGRRRGMGHRSAGRSNHKDTLRYYAAHAYEAKHGEAKVISAKQFRKMKSAEGDFCFMGQLEQPSDKA